MFSSVLIRSFLLLKVTMFAEKARIEAQIKAAEAAARRKELDDLKMRRETERKAARIALEKVHHSFLLLLIIVCQIMYQWLFFESTNNKGLNFLSYYRWRELSS